ncbi:MAG: cytochrome c3 family protein [Polyangiaceae bacterium]|jgi:hypothetical protein
MQIFPRSFNRLAVALGTGSALGLTGVVLLAWYYFSPRYTQVGYSPKQPVPYSHRLHVDQLGMDCRYCHANVERAPVAMVPPTETCMNCHQLVRTDSKLLEPIRDSWVSGQPVQWIRVHKLPDYAYFDHSVHVNSGVGCAECHGRVDLADQVRQETPLSMGWCLECHRDVRAKQGDSVHIRPQSEITNMAWIHTGHVDPARLLDPPVNCAGCHR